MRSRSVMMQALGEGAGPARWGGIALLALALQARCAWLLLGVWLSVGGVAVRALPVRLKMLPAHPDWVLPALVQSVVAALVGVALARRWRVGWVVLAAAVAGGVAWAVAFANVPNGLGGYLLVVQPVQEMLVMALLLAAVALSWRWLGRWAAVPALALVGGAGAGALRLALTYTIFGVAWPEEWPRELAGELVAVALLGLVIAVLRGRREASAGPGAAGAARWSGAALGTLGLLALTVLHLAAGSALSGWTIVDSRVLAGAALGLALLAAGALVAAWRAARRRPA